ncbi:uncharacterized protein LOC114303733 [Camellia sinensis]|uniref:uncharacterized protein LOC114303733 n=1 Tax=Camellia sinensis TaxID=4442 RepID=UPI001036E091|nr:uncharacterized protein LOC114303733 [Camellia sinensis]
MADDIPFDGVPSEVLPPPSPATEVEELAAKGIAADLEAEFASGLEPKPLSLGIRPFDLEAYHSGTHILLSGGIKHFSDFACGTPEDLLLREPDNTLFSWRLSHLQRIWSGDGQGLILRAPRRCPQYCRRVWLWPFLLRTFTPQSEPAPPRSVGREVVGHHRFFHFSFAGELTMTPYDFSMLTGLRVGRGLIRFDTDMGEWEATWIFLLGARPLISRLVMVRYSWFSEHFCKSEPVILEEIK